MGKILMRGIIGTFILGALLAITARVYHYEFREAIKVHAVTITTFTVENPKREWYFVPVKAPKRGIE